MPSPGRNEETFCVFASPTELKFIRDDTTTHKQILSISNPYGFSVLYKIKCANPHNYSVSPAEGGIRSFNAQDVIIRHKELAENVGTSDVIRVELLTHKRHLFGYKDIPVELLETCPVPPQVDEAASAAKAASKAKPTPEKQAPTVQTHDQCGCSFNLTVCWLALIVCAIVLYIFPNESELDERFPMFLHLNHKTRNFLAFFIGCIITYIFQARRT